MSDITFVLRRADRQPKLNPKTDVILICPPLPSDVPLCGFLDKPETPCLPNFADRSEFGV